MGIIRYGKIALSIFVIFSIFFRNSDNFTLAQSQDVKREIFYADKDYITLDLLGEKEFTLDIESKNGGSVDWVGYVIELDAKEFSNFSEFQKKAKDKRTKYTNESVSTDKIIYAQAKSYFRYIDVISTAIDYAAEKAFGSALEDTAALSHDSEKIYLIRAYSGGLGKSDDPKEKAFVRSGLAQGKSRDTQAAALNIFAVVLDTFGLFIPFDSTFEQDDLKRIAAIGLSEATHAFGEVDVMSGHGDAKDIFEIIVRSSKAMLKEFIEIAQKEATKNFLRFISKNAEMAIKAINITSKISKGGKIVDRVYQMEWQATPLETSYVMTPKARMLLDEKKPGESKKSESTSIQWKTVSKEFFTIQIPQTWKETTSQKSSYYASIFRFEGAEGEFFEVGIDPVPAGRGSADQIWILESNSSNDGVVIKSFDTDGTSYDNLFDEGRTFPSKGNGKLEINALVNAIGGDYDFVIQGHLYDFFFGNDKKETGVDTEIFKAMLNSFRAKKAINQKPVTPPTMPPLTSEKIVRIIANNVQLLTANSLGGAPLGGMIGTAEDRLSDNTKWEDVEGGYLNRGDTIEYVSEKSTRGDPKGWPQATRAVEVKSPDGKKGWVVTDWFYKGETIVTAEVLSKDELSKQIPPALSLTDIKGHWGGIWKGGGDSGTFELDIKDQSDRVFTGKGSEVYNGQTQSFTIGGAIFKDKMFFDKYYPNGNFVKYEGTFSGIAADGSWKSSSFDSGTWSMAR